MKIGLIDVDGHNYPNLPLMKLSAWHKSKGDDVEILFPMFRYDKVYMSKVFDFTPDYNTAIYADEIVAGGTGYNLTSALPDEVENIFPDYSIYNTNNTAYGFLTRGCPRACTFCIVSEKEGKKSYQVANIDNFYNGQKYIELLDPNILACKDHMKLLRQIKNTGAWINFNQGLDARFLTDKNTEIIKSMKIKMIHFAWDYMKNENIIIDKLKRFKEQSKIDFRRLRVYVLTNFDTTHEQDIYRVEILKSMGYDPYIMVYDKHKAPAITKQLQRYVNNKIIFRACSSFHEYDNKR